MRALTAVFTVLAASLAFGQVNPPPKMSVKLDRNTVKAGAVLKGTITLTFAPGYHGYQNPPSDKFQIPIEMRTPNGGFRVVKVTYPEGFEKMVAGSDKPSRIYEGEIKIPFELRAPTKAGRVALKIGMGYQQCNEDSCFPPGDVTVTVNVTVTK